MLNLYHNLKFYIINNIFVNMKISAFNRTKSYTYRCTQAENTT